MKKKLKLYNHEYPTLSDLDKEMISHVPQGGNWQDIPISVPSKRLAQIRKMTEERGVVRTTYYGRLIPHQPSYTISTYYNRPGNGTHIHPIENRTLTSREAARLQSFPDKYRFYGSEGAIRKQIGNAVPPLLSYAIGKQLINTRGNKTCVDMFCGAGGLSLGLDWAGWNIVAAIDNDKLALETYKNNHKINDGAIIRADLLIENERKKSLDKIIKLLKGKRLHLLAGGPPCQGFSHAGFRVQDDIRNNLAANYLTFAKELKPKIFLLENVEGLLTMNKGQVLQDLILSLEEIGYQVIKPIWKLNAEEYGVPQMRRRVFLMATLDIDGNIERPISIFNPCLGRRKTSKLLTCTKGRQSPINIAEAFMGLSYNKLSKGLRKKYSDWVSGAITVNEFIASF